MATTQKAYLQCVRATLDAALCIRNFGSQTVERHNKPEVEVKDSKELSLKPIKIARTAQERVLIETSVNSVRFSIALKKADHLEHILASQFTRFLMQRAEHFIILRRKAVDDYDISFLITNKHLERMWKHKLIDFVIQFMEDVDREISAMKISVNARSRAVATELMKALA
ncbi:hypothetical protein FNF27_00863 [Cafeteria roenbergensis]|uniref:Actin-related protein 2/3 complex subunit 4 n=1 Tax=Cafeteria roenbergensis TaxID=33653 RepID=A0A5A8CV68_CAFRO|nr:hypothetical protein FNF29_01110 [Cafeteria roenbergensis]KAA0168422.1 hypothetical protein FNF31_00304 [Cafeteria roenbergensis]KAA0177691.1 hypothetical protein FNF27_00863 [Cafeteria roenbergensis]|eukprot:KAA0156317.1 hypothetical protein FNF29_01110 [Cafeteria roenbergensis]